jgi:hypothetical protein
LPEIAKLPPLRFPYGAVEKALATIYAAIDDDVRRQAFRARINYFQRAKVLGEDVAVGKGTKNDYSIVQIERWFACLELTELGLSPTTVGELIKGHWDLFEPIFKAAQRSVVYEPGPDDTVLCLGGVHFMSSNWAPQTGFPGVPSIQGCALAKLPDRVMAWMQMARYPTVQRLLIVNLSQRLRQFHTALGDAYTEELIAERTGGKVKKRV